jgi:hypothetical protein
MDSQLAREATPLRFRRANTLRMARPVLASYPTIAPLHRFRRLLIVHDTIGWHFNTVRRCDYPSPDGTLADAYHDFSLQV